MKVVVTLDRGDAALGTFDFETLRDLVARAVEESMVDTIFRQMPGYYSKDGKRELFDDEDMMCRDFEQGAKATLRWMIRNFTIAAKRVPEIPASDQLLQTAEVRWPRSEKP